MERNFEAALAKQCAPTLAGIKPASLFCWTGIQQADFPYWRDVLAPYGMEVRVLKACPADGSCLVYLFREAWLREILSNPPVRAFLRRLGYPDADCGALLAHLSRRLRFREEFPHEIGVFLGYPLEDVTGFMKHHGQNYTYCGCWKVYGNPAEAKRRFAAYHRCTAFYCAQIHAGVPLAYLLSA